MMHRFDILFMIPAKKFADKIYKRLNNLEIPEGTRSISMETRIENRHVVFLLYFGTNTFKHSCEPYCPTWDSLYCEPIKSLSENIKSKCRDGHNMSHEETIIRKYKIYVNGHQSLLAYVMNIKNGRVTKDFNRKIWGVVLCNWNWVNHNIGKSILMSTHTDINILNFKFKKV